MNDELAQLRPAVEDSQVHDPDAPKPVGRPPRKYSKAVHEIIVQELRRGQRAQGACARAGITVNTFQNWIQLGKNGDPHLAQFAEDVEIAYNAAEADVVEGLLEVTNDAEARVSDKLEARKFWLERQRADGYSKQVKTLVDKQIEGFMRRLESALAPHIFEQVLAVYLGHNPNGGELQGDAAPAQLTQHGTSEEHDDTEGEQR